MALVVKNMPNNAVGVRDLGLIPGWEKSPGKRNDNPIQYSPRPALPQAACGHRSAENPMKIDSAGLHGAWGFCISN